MLAWAEQAEADLRAEHSGFLLHEEIASLPAIIGERTHLSRGQVAHRLGTAQRTRDKTPKVWNAFAVGRLDYARVREINTAVERLQRPRSIERLENRVVDYAERHTVAELRHWLKLFVANVEADLFAERADEERTKRGIDVVHGDDGMSWLSIYAPSLHIAAVTSKLTKGAKALGNDDSRTLDQRKVPGPRALRARSTCAPPVRTAARLGRLWRPLGRVDTSGVAGQPGRRPHTRPAEEARAQRVRPG